MNKTTSLFGGYAENMQAIIDKRMDRFKVPIFEKFLDYAPAQVELSFVDVIGKSRIEAIASVVGDDATSPLRSRMGLSKLKGSIPTISHKYAMSKSDYRNYQIMQNQTNVKPDEKKKQIIDMIFADVKNASDGCVARLDVMFLQALSTGLVDLSATGNPDGVAYGSIDILMPVENQVTTAKIWATDDTATPLLEIENLISLAKAKGTEFGSIQMSQATFNIFRQSKEIQGVFKTALVTNLVTLANVNAFMSANGLPSIELIDNMYGIEENGVLRTIKPFADGVMVFVPAGKLGTVKNAIPVEGGMTQVSGHTYADVNRVKIAKWSQTEPFQEYTRGELLAFPAISSIDSVYHLKMKA